MKAKEMICVLMLVLTVVACQHEESVGNNVESQSLCLSATIDNGAEISRSNVTDDGYFTWASGDAISVYTTNSDFKDFVISESDGVGTSKANFVGNLDNGVSVSTCAVYPAFSGEGGHTYDADNNSITFQLRETYDLEDNTENTNALMLALIGEDKDNLRFKHVGGVMRFVLQNVPKGASEFVFKASDKGITGPFVLDIDNEVLQINAKNFEENETVDDNVVSIKFTPLAESKDLKFFIPLPLGEYHGFTIQVKHESGTILYERNSTATNTIKLRTLTKMPSIVIPSVVEVKTAEALNEALTVVADATTISLSDDAVNVETIDIPTSLTDTQEQAELNLIYSDLPTNEITIRGTGDSSSTENEDGLGRLQISIPQAESDETPSFNIELPTMTVTLSASIEHATFENVTASTAENTLIIAPGVTIKNLIVKKGNVRVKKGGVINSISTTETDETIYVIYEGEIPGGVQNTENLQHISAEFWESASNGGIYSEGVATLLKPGSLKKVLGDDRLNVTSLKVVGKINGDDICCLREMAGRNAYQNTTAGRLEILDLSEASIVEGGSFYYYVSSTQSHYTSKDVIGERMFSSTNLKEVQLPKGIVTIEPWAFFSCENLQSAAIYDKVVSIKDGAFSSCYSLSSVNIPSSVEEIGFQAFVNCSKLDEMELPDGIKLLGSGAFSGCGLASIVLPNSVESIGSELLAGCKNLTKVTLSERVGYIGDAMFKNCTELQAINIPDGIHTIGNYAFEGCTKLYDVDIPESVTTIRDGAFYNCDVLAQITLPKNLEKISYSLFLGCDRLWSVNIPDGVNEIGREAFSNCRSLKTIEIPSSVKTIGYSAFFYSSLTGRIVIPGSVETIGGGAFGSTSLSEIEMEEGVKVIGGGAFGSTNIKKITIPESVETIEAYAFQECYQLINAFILGPTEIRPNVFYKCTQLKSIKFYSLTPSEKSDTSMGGVVFNNPPCELYVPAEAYDAYYQIYGNSSFTINIY